MPFKNTDLNKNTYIHKLVIGASCDSAKLVQDPDREMAEQFSIYEFWWVLGLVLP